MGPVAFVIVFMLIPLAAAVFAAGFFATVALYNVLSDVPTSAWAALTVGAAVVVAARLWVVVRALNGSRPGVGQGPQAGRRSRQELR